MERRRRFSRINLASDSIISLQVIGEFARTDERISTLERLPTIDPPLPQPWIMSIVSYRPPQAEPHEIFLGVRPPEREASDPQILVHLRYSTEATDSLPKSNPYNRAESEIWPIIIGLGRPERLWASVEFRFVGRGGEDLWFPLPASLGGARDPEDVFEIRTVAGVKEQRPDSPNPGYRFNLSCPFGKDVTVRLSFDLDGEVHPSIVRTVQRQALRLVPDLVPPA